MNLAELAAFVCEKVRKTDPLSVAACKGFINRRYQMIYDAETWRDSLFLSTPTMDPTFEQAAIGIYQIPILMDRIIAVRTSKEQLRVAQTEEFFRIDTDVFDQTGSPALFSILPPMAWDLGEISATFYDLAYADAPGAQLTGGYQNAADVGKIITVTYQTNDGTIGTYDIPISEPYLTSGAVTYYLNASKVISAKKAVTIGTVALLAKVVGGGSLGFTMAPNDTELPKYSRLKLTYIPTVTTTLRILFKMKWAALTDNDSPVLRGLDNALAAFAQSDMLQRERQYAKANLLATEGINLLDQYKKVEVYQQAFDSRFVPDAEPLFSNNPGNNSWLRGYP